MYVCGCRKSIYVSAALPIVLPSPPPTVFTSSFSMFVSLCLFCKPRLKI